MDEYEHELIRCRSDAPLWCWPSTTVSRQEDVSLRSRRGVLYADPDRSAYAKLIFALGFLVICLRFFALAYSWSLSK